MGSYHPEGECYFVRSSLKFPNGWNADNKNHFYSHVLIEYYWNGWAATNTISRFHPRSVWSHGQNQGLPRTRFGDWDRFWVGESKDKNPSNMTAIHSHPNSNNWNECRDLRDGGPRKYILRPIQIHSKDAEWLWIDGTIPLRAIYFPVAQQTDQAFPNLCTYVVIDFRHRGEIDIIDFRGRPHHKLSVTSHGGLGWRDTMTWGFHIPDIIAYLAIPHKLRNPDYRLFKSKDREDDLVVCAPSTVAWRSSSAVLQHPYFFREIDFANILSATFGVEVGWRPFEPSNFLRNLLISLIDLGLGFIPGVGPILSVAFGIAVQLFEDPESFSLENILDINQAARDNLASSAKKHRKYLAPNFMAKPRGPRALIPLSDDERARRQKYGEELNAKLIKELNPQVVIRSLLEQELLMYGSDSINGPGKEGEQAELETVPIDATEEKKEAEEEEDEDKKDE
ncbi:unnamed protein product [Fusarium langsethiae]|nr:unnamed protein product [Fusarium langsethiae]